MSESAEPQVNLLDPAFMEDPYASYSTLAAETPVAVDPNVGVAVFGHEYVSKLVRDTKTLSNELDPGGSGNLRMGVGVEPVPEDVLAILAEAHAEQPALFTSDPPEHTAHRRLANLAFNPRRMRAMEPEIRVWANELVDGFAARGSVNLTTEYAIPLPLYVIGGILGVDKEHVGDVQRWTADFLSGMLDVLGDDRRRDVARSTLEFQEFFIARIEERRAERYDDLLGDLVTAEIEGGRRLEISELLPMIAQFATAGHETTSNLIANSMVLMLRTPGLQARLRAEPQLIPNFLEESLRFDAPVQVGFRRSTGDTEVGGCPVHSGQMVALMIGAANRDPAVFSNPDTFDPDRPNVKRHLSFGFGPHFCVGSELARLEARVAYETLFERLGEIELDAAASDLTHVPAFAHRTYHRVALSFIPEATA